MISGNVKCDQNKCFEPSDLFHLWNAKKDNLPFLTQSKISQKDFSSELNSAQPEENSIGIFRKMLGTPSTKAVDAGETSELDPTCKSIQGDCVVEIINSVEPKETYSLSSSDSEILPIHYQILRESFQRCDNQNRGYLSLQELKELLLNEDFMMSENEANIFLEKIELDSCERITLDEFISAIRPRCHHMNNFSDKLGLTMDSGKFSSRTSIGCLKSFGILMNRVHLQMLRDHSVILFDIGVMLIVGILIGLIYGPNWAITEFPLMVVLISLALAILSSNASLRVFGSERLNYQREILAGISRTAYFLSKQFANIYQVIIYPFILSSLVFNILAPDFDFMFFYLVLILVSWSGSGIGMLVSIVLPPLPASMAGIFLPLILGGFLSGNFPYLINSSLFLQYLTWCSPTRWAAHSLVLAEIQALPAHLPSKELLLYQGYPQEKIWISIAFTALFIQGFCYRIVSYFFLRRK